MGGGWIVWLASPPFPPLEKQNIKKFEKGCEYYGRNKGKLLGQIPRCNFYFVALLEFLVKWFSITFQFSNCNILGTCPIDSATPRYQPPSFLNTPLQLHTFLVIFTRSGQYKFVCYRSKGKEKKKNERKTMLTLRYLCFQYKFNSELDSLLNEKAPTDWQSNLPAMVVALVEQINICNHLHNCRLGDLKPPA